MKQIFENGAFYDVVKCGLRLRNYEPPFTKVKFQLANCNQFGQNLELQFKQALVVIRMYPKQTLKMSCIFNNVALKFLFEVSTLKIVNNKFKSTANCL